VLLGSHLDTVVNGGNFDGAAGVLAGLAAVAGMKQAGWQPRCDIGVMVTRAEEAGAWFPTSFPGSRGALGALRAEELAIARLDSGRSLADHMREEGFDPEFARRGERVLGPDNVAAYLEVHIEQGPVLDAMEIPVGIVTGIPGSRRLRTGRVLGEYNHSGGTPRKYRRDAAIALADLAVALDDAWCTLDARGQQLVVTFCTMGTTAEAGFTKVAGEATFQLDVRSVNLHSIDAIWEVLYDKVPEIEARRGVTFELGTQSGSPASLMDAGVQDGLKRAAMALDIGFHAMASGGGHDAVAFAQAGVPAGMLFVRNQNGSHNPKEAMRMEDFAKACAVAQRWAAEMSA
jgi:N-carbamoyl-L-amino-acid hydrolase